VTPTSPCRWAVVLGASSGVGAAIARDLAVEGGYDVFAVHRGNWPDGAAEVEAAVTAAGRRCVFWTADAGSAEAAAEGVARLRAVAGAQSVGFFVHSLASACVGRLAIGEDPLHPRQLTRTFDRMAHSFVYWAQGLHQGGLLAPGGRLLGLSNLMTDEVVRGAAAIAATKAALEMYVRHLALELGPLGHRVNLLKFGFVPTAAAQRTFPAEAFDRLQAVMQRGTPAGRLCTPDEVARFVTFLASPGAEWFNGATIDFTGAESQSFFDQLVYAGR
jgi:NAD(P)-dependent dehydrogenase (short-subunit alcohol dehydrogenase family)